MGYFFLSTLLLVWFKGRVAAPQFLSEVHTRFGHKNSVGRIKAALAT